MIALLPVLLLACAAPGVDTGVDTGSGADTGSAPPLLPACEGADFDFDAWGEPYPTNPWWFVRTMQGDFLPPLIALERAAESGDCPTMEVDGERETFSGDCEEDGVSFAGTWTHEGSIDEIASLRVAVEGSALSGDGRFRWEYGENHTTYLVEADGAYQRGLGDQHDGVFAFEGLRFEWTAEALRGAGRVSVDWLWGSGSYCLTAEISAAEACPSHADGYWAIQGAQTYTFMPTGCDDCVDVYRDGVWERTQCEMNGSLLL